MEKELKKKIKEEGDFLQGEFLGLPFVLWRHDGFGHWCGYVGVPKGSRLNGKDYYISTESENGLSKIEEAINNIEVHGGLTFAGTLSHREVKDGLWYFGFDCGHCNDLEPFIFEKYPSMEHGIYRDKEYVIGECKSLAKQLKNIIDLKL